jgi:hypothetical protein
MHTRKLNLSNFNRSQKIVENIVTKLDDPSLDSPSRGKKLVSPKHSHPASYSAGTLSSLSLSPG